MLDESVKCIDQEMASFDQDERIDRPPKKVQKQASSEAEAEVNQAEG